MARRGRARDTVSHRARENDGTRSRKKVEVPRVLGESAVAGAVRNVPLSNIRLADDTFQFRIDVSSRELKQSIEREGQQFPVILRGRRPPYQLICGFRRIKALQDLGKPTAKAIVLPEISRERSFRLSFLENKERASLTELDIANAVAKLKLAGKQPAEVAGVIGRSVRQIQRYLEVSRFPAELKRAVASRKITLGHGLVLNRALVDGKRVNLSHWLDRIQQKKLSVPALKRHLGEAFGKHKRVYYFRKRGKGFRIASFEYNPDKATPRERREILSALRKAIALLRKAG